MLSATTAKRWRAAHDSTIRSTVTNNDHKPASPVSDLTCEKEEKAGGAIMAGHVMCPRVLRRRPLSLFSEFSSARLPFPHPLRFVYATLRLSPTTAHGSRSPSRKWRARRTASAPQWIPLDLLHASCSARVLSSCLSPIFCGTWFLLGVWWRPLSATLPTFRPISKLQRGRGGWH
jgi:hypothetical protein